MENKTLVRDYLGGKSAIGKPESDSDFLALIRLGFKPKVLASLVRRTHLTEENLLQILGIARRTAARRKAKGARLKPAESEAVLRLARVLAFGTQILGDEEKAREWVQRSNRALGGTPPIKILDTGIGFEMVMNVLRRIEAGVYS